MSSELEKMFEARLKNTESSEAPSSKPPLAKKPPPPAKSLNLKSKVGNKINASLKPDKPPLKAKPKPTPPHKPAPPKPAKVSDTKPSPGATALASVLLKTSKATTNGGSESFHSLPRSPKHPLNRSEKALSVEIKPRSASDLTRGIDRPHSSSVDEDFISESPRLRSSPVMTPNSSPLARKKRTNSASPVKAASSPLHNAASIDCSSDTVKASDSKKSSPVREVLKDRNERASSLPRDGLLKPATPSKARSISDLRKIDQKQTPPTLPKKPPVPSTKPKLQPKPQVPLKPPSALASKSASNLNPVSNGGSSETKRKIASPPLVTAKKPPTSPPPSNGGSSETNRKASSPPLVTAKKPLTPPPRKTPTPEILKKTKPSLTVTKNGASPENEGSPDSTSKEEQEFDLPEGGALKSPSQEFAAQVLTQVFGSPSSGGLSPGPTQRIREKTDSGFGSEAPDDITLPATARLEVQAEKETDHPMSPTKETPEVWDQAKLDKAKNKRHNIALELLSTEKTYVDRLKCIAVDFHGIVTEFNAKNKQAIPQSVVQQIFLNIQQIHTLNENILQELQQRMDSWATHEGIGDVLARLAPFLKLYTTYTAGFEDAMKTLTEWTKKDKKFDALIRDFERSSLTTGLGVAHYMLEPVQRIPRYKLLLSDYLKNLPPESPDKPNTTKALGIIAEAADRTNDRIKELENSNEILAIQRSLTDYEGSLVAPSRIFIKKGELKKSSRKTETPRMFFLFTDILLHTKVSGSETYELRNEMPIYGMKVEEPKVSLVPHSFNVHSTTRALILVARSEEEKDEWMTALNKVIYDDMRKRTTLKRDTKRSFDEEGDVAFGAQAPIMVPDKSVTMCQGCTAQFSFTFRRHHCRACGKVMCGGCSQWKAYLPYMDKSERVCEACFEQSKGSPADRRDSLTSSVTKRQEPPPTSVLHLKGLEDDAVIAAYVLSMDGRNWKKLWYQVKTDFVLYKFKAHEDIKGIHSMPLPGYIVEPEPEKCIIKLIHPSKNKELCDTFKVEDPAAYESWLTVLVKVVNMELPEQGLLSPCSNRSSLIDSIGSPCRPASGQHSIDSLPRPASGQHSIDSLPRPASGQHSIGDCQTNTDSQSRSGSFSSC